VCTCADSLYWASLIFLKKLWKLILKNLKIKDGFVCVSKKLPYLNCTTAQECINNTICTYAANTTVQTTCQCYYAYYYNVLTQTCGKK
jgi:hypothetical protein